MRPPFNIDLSTSKNALEELKAGGLFIPHDANPPLFEAVSVCIQLPGNDGRTLKGQVVNHTPTGFYVLLENRETVAEIIGILTEAGTSISPSDADHEPNDPSITASQEGEPDGGRQRITPAWLRDQKVVFSLVNV